MHRLKQLRTAPLLMRRATAALPVRRFLGTAAQPHKPAEHGHGEHHDAHDHGHDSHGHAGKLDKIAEKLEGPFGKMDKALDKVYGGLWGLTGPALKFVGKSAATAGNGAFNVLRESTGVFASRQQRQGISDASAFDLGAIPPNDPREINEKPQVTVLPNGIRVVSVESHNPILSIGAYFDAGSRFETRESHGFTQLIPEVAFLSTRNRSAFRMTREANKIGATFDCISGREHVLFAAHGFPANAEELIGTLADVILEPKLAENEVDEAAAALEEKSAGIFDEPSVWIAESMHEAAFLKNSLGVRYYTPLSNLRMNMVDGLAEYYTYLFTPKRLTVSGVGIEHSKLVALTKEAFSNLSEPEEVVDREPAQYTGGELRLHKKGDDLTHFALGFRGASWKDSDVVPLGVLQAILNGSGSGRPTRHTGIGGGQSIARLSRLVDNADGLLAATSFVNTYSDAGLFALYGTAEPGQAGKVVDAMIKEAHALAGPVEASELKAAKAQLKNVILGGASRTDQLDDIARQVVNTGSARTPSELCALVDRVSENDISKAAKKLLNSPPSVVALGNLAFVPQYDTIASRFK